MKSFCKMVEIDHLLLSQKNKVGFLYFFITATFIIIIASLPFIKTNISIISNGIIRPISERTEVKSMIVGIIDTLFVHEGDTLQDGQIIAIIKDNISMPKKILNDFELNLRFGFVHDLELLTSGSDFKSIQLQTPLYKQQFYKFQFQVTDQQAALKKVNNEIKINKLLINDKIITPKEYFDKEVEVERLSANFNAFKNEQISIWQNELQKFRLEIAQFKLQKEQIDIDKRYHYLYSPVRGIVQNINTRYAGGIVSAGETICIVSPEKNLIGECFVSTRDIGLLKAGQLARFQIDAFDYNYFGILTGKIMTIDNDFSIIENKPIFKVRCSFDSTQLMLKNGYKGELKKGLTFQVRFVLAERSLWQLLFDKVDDWLNPTSPLTAIN